MIQLSAAQVAHYHVEGYLTLPPLTTVDEIASLRAIYDHHFEVCSGREQGAQFDLFGDDKDPAKPNVPQILGLSRFAPEVKQTALYANVKSVVAQLLGVEMDLGDHAIRKPPFCPSATPWHQDEAYWDMGRDHCSLSVWVPLQDVDQASGCMHFVPRSHFGEILPHRSAGNNPAVHGLELDGDFPELLKRAVACPLAAGGCTIHHNRTLHYASANQKAEPRRAWIFGGGVSVQRQAPWKRPWEEAKRTLRDQRAKDYAAKVAAGRQAVPA
jgi:hypothetical protein